MHRDDAPPSPRTLNPLISPALETILLKVLAKEPSARYRTADQLGRVLVTFTGQYNPVTQIVDTEGTTGTFPARLPAEAAQTSPSPHVTPVRTVSPAPVPMLPRAVDHSTPADSPLDFDWLTIALGLMALIAVGGLIPFSLWVYFLYF
jgi:serine/threonine-protein kinase